MGMNLFNSVMVKRPPSNIFNLSHDVKMSLRPGKLYPTLCLETVPGDRFDLGCDMLIRLQPLLAPMMHRVDAYMHYFFVPNRLIWANWDKFITNTKNPTTVPAVPFVTLIEDGANYTELMDYMGLPSPDDVAGPDTPENVSALPFAAYQLIFNEYYRDENLVSEVDYKLVDGDNTTNVELYKIRRRAWEHDYFTSALPFAQKGDPVTLPLTFSDTYVFRDDTTTTVLQGVPDDIGVGAVPSADIPFPYSGLYAATSGLEGSSTINDLRRAYRLQEWLEKAARGGTRYTEFIRAFFGVNSSDKRLQRPEFITGTTAPVVISEVLNTTGTPEAPQGNMAGHGVGVQQGRVGSYFCEEYGYIIGIMSVRPKTAYFQGIPKHFLKTVDPFQYFTPPFANIGEQEILNKELYAFRDTGNDTFGYTPRYSEYKFINSGVRGDFRRNLDFWHWARKFNTIPALNNSFINCNPSDTPFAVDDPNTDNMYCHVYHKIRASRLMPKYGTPTF